MIHCGCVTQSLLKSYSHTYSLQLQDSRAGHTAGTHPEKQWEGNYWIALITPRPIIGVSPLPPLSVTGTTRRDSRAVAEEGQRHQQQLHRHGHHTSNSHGGLCTGNREWSSFPRDTGVTSQLPPAAKGLWDTLPGQGVALTPPCRGHTVVTVLPQHPPCHTGQVGKGQRDSPLCQLTKQILVDPKPQEISEKL